MRMKLLFLSLLSIWIFAIVIFITMAPGLHQIANGYYAVADFFRTFLPILLGLIILTNLSHSLRRSSVNQQNVSTIIPLAIGIYVYWIFYPMFESSFSTYREFIKHLALIPLEINSDSAIFNLVNRKLYINSAAILSNIVIGIGLPIPALILGAFSTITSFIGLTYFKRVWAYFSQRWP